MGSMSLFHWLVVLVVLCFVLGRERLRHLGRDLGRVLRDFQSALHEEVPVKPAETSTDRVLQEKKGNDSQ